MFQGSRHFSLLVSTVRSFFRSNQTFLHSFNQSLPPLPSYRLRLLFLFLSFSLDLRGLPCSLHRLAGSLVFVQVYVFISLAPRSDLASSASPLILRIIRVPRNLILWALCISLRFSSRVLLTRVYLSSSDLVEGFCPVRSGIMGS